MRKRLQDRRWFLVWLPMALLPASSCWAADADSDPWEGSPDSNAALTDRRITPSVLSEVFGNGVLSLPEVSEIGKNEVFGLRLNPYDLTTLEGHRLAPSTESVPVAGPVREGYRIKACLAIDQSWGSKVDQPRLKKALFGSTEKWVVPADGTVQKAYSFFNPGQALSRPQLASLLSVSSSSDPGEVWRKIFLALCLDPSWQWL